MKSNRWQQYQSFATIENTSALQVLTRRIQEVHIDNTGNCEESVTEERSSASRGKMENQHNSKILTSGENSERSYDLGHTNGVRGGDDEVSEYIDCPSPLVGKLIGKGGETIQAIQNSTGTRIQIDQSVPDAFEKKVVAIDMSQIVTPIGGMG